MTTTRLGVLGDLHGAFDAEDAALLDALGYDAIVCIGDLGPGTPAADVRVARALARLRTPVVVMPGNNDCETAPLIRAELGLQAGLAALLGRSGAALRPGLAAASGRATWAGYGRHRIGGAAVTFLSGRPYSMGGPSLAFAEALRERHGVSSLDDSAARLCALVDAAETDALVFLAHNGPTGLGDTPDAPFGKDFEPGGGDHGDPDLRAAIDHAKARGKRVLAVIAGHMHHRLRGGGTRRDRAVDADGTLYVNVACLPRIVPTDEGTRRHHVELVVTAEGAQAEARWMEG